MNNLDLQVNLKCNLAQKIVMKGLSQHEQVVTEPTTLTAWPASGTLLSGSLADLGKEVATPAPLGPAHLRKKRLEVCESSSLGHRST